MATIRDVVVFLCRYYPHKNELSKSRLTKLVYLADWRSCIRHEVQITPIQWEYNYYGPYVEDVVEAARRDPGTFEVIGTSNYYGERKDLVRLIVPNASYPSVNEQERSILDFVINTTSSKSWDDFIKLVYSTYPITTQPKFSHLDLVSLAKRYRQELEAV